MRQHEYAKVARVVQNSFPDIFKMAQERISPALSDLKRIKRMKDYYFTNYAPPQSGDDYTYKLTFIAAILKLFSPTSLYDQCRLAPGLCKSLRDVLGYNHSQSITPFIPAARVYITRPSFNQRVDEFAELFKLIDQQLDLPQNKYGQILMF